MQLNITKPRPEPFKPFKPFFSSDPINSSHREKLTKIIQETYPECQIQENISSLGIFVHDGFSISARSIGRLRSVPTVSVHLENAVKKDYELGILSAITYMNSELIERGKSPYLSIHTLDVLVDSAQQISTDGQLSVSFSLLQKQTSGQNLRILVYNPSINPQDYHEEISSLGGKKKIGINSTGSGSNSISNSISNSNSNNNNNNSGSSIGGNNSNYANNQNHQKSCYEAHFLPIRSSSLSGMVADPRKIEPIYQLREDLLAAKRCMGVANFKVSQEAYYGIGRHLKSADKTLEKVNFEQHKEYVQRLATLTYSFSSVAGQGQWPLVCNVLLPELTKYLQKFEKGDKK